jgi:hypothetical protein
MPKPRAKRPSPALLISMTALFVAIGGSAYAAKKIGAKQIKKIAVSGAKINESSLGPVPSATNAENATNAVNAANFSRYCASGLKKASPGQTVTLLTVGPFTITGKCVDADAEVVAHSYITTSQAGSNLYGYASNYYEGDFNPAGGHRGGVVRRGPGREHIRRVVLQFRSVHRVSSRLGGWPDHPPGRIGERGLLRGIPLRLLGLGDERCLTPGEAESTV